MSNLAILGMALALLMGCLVGHLAWLLITQHPDNYGGPIMGILGILALGGGVAVVEALDHRERGEPQ